MNRHSLREVSRQLRESGGAGLVAVLLVTVATIWAGLLWTVRNWAETQLLARGRPASLIVTVTSPEDAATLQREIGQRFPGVSAAVLPPERVRRELAGWFPEIASVIDALPESSFPTVLDLQVDRRREAEVSTWLGRQQQASLVSSSRSWRQPLEEALRGVLIGGLSLTVTMLVGCCIVVLLVVRLMVLAHADEIEIMRLIGARERDIRLPYLVSGAVLAGAGGVIGVGLLLLALRLGPAPIAAQPVGAELLAVLLLGGPLVGTMGALLGLAALPSEP